MNEDFELFQDEFKKWQEKFGLTGYKVYFKYEPLECHFACVEVNLDNMVATVTLNSELPDKDKAFKDIKTTAKHEAIYLLLARLEKNGRYRFVTETEIYETTEELVHKLEHLIT
jgi:hypothetical protein